MSSITAPYFGYTFHDSSKFGDVYLISSDGMAFCIHKDEIIYSSRVFQCMLTGKFKEAKEKIAYLKDESAEIVYAMLSYLYRNDYNDQIIDVNKTSGPTFFLREKQPRANTFDIAEFVSVAEAQLLNVRVYITADKYDLGYLKTVAIAKFLSHKFESWQNEFEAIVSEIYDNTLSSNCAIRNALLTMVTDSIENVPTMHSLMSIYTNYPEFKEDIKRLHAQKIRKS